MAISRHQPLNVGKLVTQILLEPELLFVRIEPVRKDLPDGDRNDGGAVVMKSSCHVHPFKCVCRAVARPP